MLTLLTYHVILHLTNGKSSAPVEATRTSHNVANTSVDDTEAEVTIEAGVVVAAVVDITAAVTSQARTKREMYRLRTLPRSRISLNTTTRILLFPHNPRQHPVAAGRVEAVLVHVATVDGDPQRLTCHRGWGIGTRQLLILQKDIESCMRLGLTLLTKSLQGRKLGANWTLMPILVWQALTSSSMNTLANNAT